LTINERVYGEDHPKIANSLANIGSIHARERQHSEALQYIQKALAIRQKHLPANDRMLGESHTNIASTYRSLHKLDLALEHYNIALKIYEKCLPPQHPDLAILYNGLASIYSDKH
jgi:tetratricopeptide (TPR) repeat protein